MANKKLFLGMAAAALTFGLILTGCGGTPKPQSQGADNEQPGTQAAARSQPLEPDLIRTVPAEEPVWTYEQPVYRDRLVFVGLSPRTVLERDARRYAMEDAQRQLVEYLESNLYDEMRSVAAVAQIASDTVDQQIEEFRQSGRLAKGVSSQLKDFGYFTKIYSDGNRTGQAFVVQVRTEITTEALTKAFERLMAAEEDAKAKEAQRETDARKRKQLEDQGKIWSQAKEHFNDDMFPQEN